MRHGPTSLQHAVGIFPEDARVPQSVVARLWRQLSPGLSRFDCDEMVIDLARQALVERNAADETIALHDLLRDYARELLSSQLAATHTTLLSAYNPDGKPWPQIGQDGYLYYHLVHHLRAAGRKEELYTLLTESSDWMEARFIACTGDTAYVADLDLAIGDFADRLAVSEVPTVVKLYTARQVVHTRIRGYADTDLQTLVWLEREDEALAHARLIDSTRGRVAGLLTIYDTLKGRDQPNISLLREALELARSIEDGQYRSWALRAIAEVRAQADASALAQAERYDEAREIARSIEDAEVSWQALSDLALDLARDKCFNFALAVLLDDPGLDAFLRALAEWTPSFEQVKPGLSTTVLREASGVAGWLSLRYRKIHELLCTFDEGR
jgi:hypothetical protein